MTVSTADIMDERSVSMLRWRCRRGLLENDLYIEKFFERHGSTLSVRLGEALNRLMELGDHDLLDLQLARKTLDQVCPHLDDANTREVLSLLRENR